MSARVPLKTLKSFFLKYKGNQEIRLDQCTVIKNISTFTESHFLALEANSGKKVMLPYYDRLVKLYNLLNQKQ